MVLANDNFDGGRESALIAARVMRGEGPASFPYQGITKTRLLVNSSKYLSSQSYLSKTSIQCCSIGSSAYGCWA